MKLKIICGQLEITPGRPDVNYKKIIDAIEKARSLEADILLLPEMALPGYLIGDIWEQQTFLDDCAYYAEKSSLPLKTSALFLAALLPNPASSTRTDACASITPLSPAKTAGLLMAI